MRRRGLVLGSAFAALGASLVPTGLAAGHATVGEPADDPSLSLDPATVPSGGSFFVSLDNCAEGEQVTFAVRGGEFEGASCDDAEAAVSLLALGPPGVYTVTATGQSSGISLSAQLTITAGVAGQAPLPSTGAGGWTQLGLAIGALGAGILCLVWARRRPIGPR